MHQLAGLMLQFLEMLHAHRPMLLDGCYYHSITAIRSYVPSSCIHGATHLQSGEKHVPIHPVLQYVLWWTVDVHTWLPPAKMLCTQADCMIPHHSMLVCLSIRHTIKVHMNWEKKKNPAKHDSMLHATLITEQCYHHISLPITRSLLKRLTEQERVILEQISLVLTEGEGSLFQTMKKSWLALCHNFHQYWHCLRMPSQSSEKPTPGHSLATSLKVLQVLQVLHFLLFYQI